MKKPKIAIALDIDDLEEGNEQRKLVMSIDRPLTFVVNPNQRFSREIANEAHQKGYHVFLKLNNSFKSNMRSNNYKELLTANLKNVPHVIGINSKLDESAHNTYIIEEIFKFSKENYLLVLDSMVNNSNVTFKISKAMNVQYAKHNIFLDESATLDNVKEQIKKLAEIARQQGYAVGIGHIGEDHQDTAQAIIEMVPSLEQAGVEIVFISDLFTNYGR